MAVDDREDIERSRTQEQALAGAGKREAAERRRALKRFSVAALKAKKANDARAFAEQLRALEISEDSPEWKKAWEYFYST